MVFENLANGTYDILGMWEDGSCRITTNTVYIRPVFLPEVTVEIIHADCEGFNGAFLFGFEPRSDRDRVELSLDGGKDYEYKFDTVSGENRITALPAGTYDLWARWAGLSCGRSLGSLTIKKEMPKNADCPDVEAEETDTASLPGTKDNPVSGDTENNGDVILKLYPNPTKERIYVKNLAGKILRFQLFSARGDLVLDLVPKMENEDTYSLDIAHLQAGVYVFHISTERGNSTKQVIVE